MIFFFSEIQVYVIHFCGIMIRFSVVVERVAKYSAVTVQSKGFDFHSLDTPTLKEFVKTAFNKIK